MWGVNEEQIRHANCTTTIERIDGDEDEEIGASFLIGKELNGDGDDWRWCGRDEFKGLCFP